MYSLTAQVFQAALGYPHALRSLPAGEYRDSCVAAAATGGYINCMRDLLAGPGISHIDTLDYLGYTALTDAAWGGKAEACKICVEQGGQVREDVPPPNHPVHSVWHRYFPLLDAARSDTSVPMLRRR